MSNDARRDRPVKHTVLEVFGISLEVSNTRLAELLTMDASDALTTDVREMIGADRRAVVEALPDVVVSMSTPHSEAEAKARHEFRLRADRLGESLGFAVEGDGTWASPTGIDVVTRIVERQLTVAAASHYVGEVAAVTDRLPDTSVVLYIVSGQQTADVFKVAIRQQRLHNLMRTVSIESLEELGSLQRAGRLDHRQVLVLLAPISNIDVGEMMSVVRAERDSAPGSVDGG